MAGGIGGEARNAALLVLVLMGTAALLPPAALLVAPVPVAVFLSRGKWRQCGLILALITVTGGVTGGGFEGGAAFLMAGSVGIPLGLSMGVRATYGRAVLVTTALFFVLYALIMMGAWDDVESTVEELKAQLEEIVLLAHESAGDGMFGDISTLQHLFLVVHDVVVTRHGIDVGVGG